MKPTLEEQIATHRETIARAVKQAELCSICNQPKGAAYWRGIAANASAAIFACQHKADREFRKAFTPNKYGEYA